MYLGSRKIRSAGRTSGSIEITLPVKLHGLLGASCNIEIRDGLRPEIILQPNLATVQGLMRKLWAKLAVGLGAIGEIGDFRLSDFTVSIFPVQYWKERPPLSYADAIRVQESIAAEKNYKHDGFSRQMAFMAVRAGRILGLESHFALAFGDSLAFLTTGYATNIGADFERGLAYRLCGDEVVKQIRKANLLEDQIWEHNAVYFQKVFDQFFLWQGALEVYEEDRNNWYRALSLEMESTSSEMF